MNESFFHHKKILITGGMGFIGSNLALRLVDLGCELTLIDSLIPQYGGNLWNIEPVRQRVHLNISDVRDVHSLRYLVKGQDLLFNLAGQTSHLDSMADPFTDLEINAHAQLSLLEACRHYNPDIKLVFASTRQVYGKPERNPVNEQHPIHPVDVNGINKVAGEQYHLIYNQVYGIRSCILRLTNTYGPRMRIKDARQTFLGIWIRQILEGKPITIFGDGSQVRDFNFVEDVIDAMLLVAADEQSNGSIYNLGASDQRSLAETARLLVGLHGSGEYHFEPFTKERKAIDIGDYWADFSKIHTELGWSPRISLEEGLGTTLRYYQEHFKHYV